MHLLMSLKKARKMQVIHAQAVANNPKNKCNANFVQLSIVKIVVGGHELFLIYHNPKIVENNVKIAI